MKKIGKIAIVVIVTIGLLAFVLVQVWMFFESRSNDSMPEVLINGVKQQRLWFYPIDHKLAAGVPCEKQTITFELTMDDRCRELAFGQNGKIYFIQKYPGFFEKRLVLDSNGVLANLIVAGDKYPGNSIYDLKGDGYSVVFRYSGWQNPEKIIKLSSD